MTAGQVENVKYLKQQVKDLPGHRQGLVSSLLEAAQKAGRVRVLHFSPRTRDLYILTQPQGRPAVVTLMGHLDPHQIQPMGTYAEFRGRVFGGATEDMKLAFIQADEWLQ